MIISMRKINELLIFEKNCILFGVNKSIFLVLTNRSFVDYNKEKREYQQDN